MAAGCETVKSCPGLAEFVVRGVFLVLCVLSIISASVYFGGVAHLCGYLTKASLDHPKVVLGTCAEYRYSIQYYFPLSTINESLAFDSYGVVGLSLAVAFASAVWTALSIFHLFLQFQVLSRYKACCRTAWTIFSLMDLILLGIFSFGYLSGGFATALLADGSWKELSSFYENAATLTTDSNQAEVYKEIANNLPVSMVYDTCALVSALSFILMLFCVGMIVYFIIARAVFKLPTQGNEKSREVLP